MRVSKQNARVVTMTVMIACVWFPSAGFPEKKDSGFYAGPLSLVAEALVEVKAKMPAANETPKRTGDKDAVKAARMGKNHIKKQTAQGLN